MNKYLKVVLYMLNFHKEDHEGDYYQPSVGEEEGVEDEHQVDYYQ